MTKTRGRLDVWLAVGGGRWRLYALAVLSASARQIAAALEEQGCSVLLTRQSVASGLGKHVYQTPQREQ